MKNFQTMEFRQKSRLYFLFIEKISIDYFFLKNLLLTFSLITYNFTYTYFQYLNNLTSIYVEQIRVRNLNDT